ncbi:MAG: TlpA family protein disulfide reductase [Candidatus Solibacter usitatus]|nr:TlpA family protein disulfide reductase [Candidatus Solibacter usitatus]
MNRTLLAFCASLALCAAAFGQNGKVSKPAPAISLSLPNGTKTDLTKYNGKVRIVAFILTTCSHCQETCERLARLNKDYGPRGLQPLAAAFDDGAMMGIPDFITKHRVNFPVGVVPRDKVLEHLGFSIIARVMVPQLMFIDRKGTIRYQSSPDVSEHLHDEIRMRAVIEELLKEPAAAAKK